MLSNKQFVIVTSVLSNRAMFVRNVLTSILVLSIVGVENRTILVSLFMKLYSVLTVNIG